jgi:hypothetical protein
MKRATFGALLVVFAPILVTAGPVLTPKPGPAPKINGPKVYGAGRESCSSIAFRARAAADPVFSVEAASVVET